MKKNFSKTEAKEKIDSFFKDINEKTPSEIKKIKKLAMQYNIPLKEKRKLFCKKCCSVYKSPQIRIKNKIKIVKCNSCGEFNRTKLS